MKAEHYKNAEYAYSKVFWGEDKNRQYENEADQLLLRNAIREDTKWIADLGGGFGRLIPTLKKRSKNVVIVDASLDLLREAKATYGDDPSVQYIRANVYHLPFKDQSLESAVCMRVMHHIENPDLFFKELNRVLQKSLYLEFPNKKHILQQFRFYFLQDNTIDIFSSRPEMRDKMFLNYTLRFMKSHILKETIFSIQKISGASFLRHTHLKKLPKRILLAGESFLQRISFFAEWAPSILLTLRKNADTPPKEFSDLHEIVVCPICRGSLFINEQHIACEAGHTFEMEEGILDLFIE